MFKVKPKDQDFLDGARAALLWTLTQAPARPVDDVLTDAQASKFLACGDRVATRVQALRNELGLSVPSDEALAQPQAGA